MKKKTSLNLAALSKSLKAVPEEKQFQVKGGGDPVIILSEVSIIGDPWDDGGWGNDNGDPFGDDPIDDSYGGGGNGGTNNGDGNNDSGNDTPGENINDPGGHLDTYKTNLIELRTTIQTMITSGNVPQGITPEGMQQYIDAIDEVLDTIEMMENSHNDYRVETGNVDGADAGVYFDTETGEIVIVIEDPSDTSLFAHELHHIQQLANGELGFDANGNVTGLGLDDEVAAFQLQHDLTYGAMAGHYDLQGNPVPSGDYVVTAQDVLDAYPQYGDLPEGDGNTGGGSGASSGGSN